MNTSFLQIGDIVSVYFLGRLSIVRVLSISSEKIGVKFQETCGTVYIRKCNIHPIILTDEMKKDLDKDGEYSVFLNICNYLHEFQHILKIQVQNKRDTIEVDKIIHYNQSVLDIQVQGKSLKNIFAKYGRQIVEIEVF